jgi:hypothetical protein
MLLLSLFCDQTMHYTQLTINVSFGVPLRVVNEQYFTMLPHGQKLGNNTINKG